MARGKSSAVVDKAARGKQAKRTKKSAAQPKGPPQQHPGRPLITDAENALRLQANLRWLKTCQSWGILARFGTYHVVHWLPTATQLESTQEQIQIWDQAVADDLTEEVAIRVMIDGSMRPRRNARILKGLSSIPGILEIEGRPAEKDVEGNDMIPHTSHFFDSNYREGRALVELAEEENNEQEEEDVEAERPNPFRDPETIEDVKKMLYRRTGVPTPAEDSTDAEDAMGRVAKLIIQNFLPELENELSRSYDDAPGAVDNLPTDAPDNGSHAGDDDPFDLEDFDLADGDGEYQLDAPAEGPNADDYNDQRREGSEELDTRVVESSPTPQDHHNPRNEYKTLLEEDEATDKFVDEMIRANQDPFGITENAPDRSNPTRRRTLPRRPQTTRESTAEAISESDEENRLPVDTRQHTERPTASTRHFKRDRNAPEQTPTEESRGTKRNAHTSKQDKATKRSKRSSQATASREDEIDEEMKAELDRKLLSQGKKPTKKGRERLLRSRQRSESESA